MKYINHHSLRNFNNVYMCVNIGFNECFDDTERIRAVYSLRNLILKFKRRNDMQLLSNGVNAIPCRKHHVMRGDILPWKGTVCPSVDCPGGHCTLVQNIRGGHCTLVQNVRGDKF